MQSSDLSSISTETCEEPSSRLEPGFKDLENDGIVSFQSEIPADLQVAMTSFIERYPNWDQYRLIQAALAGFLVQHGSLSRSMTRLYVGKMFACDSLA